jgi:carbon monoxide dehydrogenase subunit G
MTEINSEAPVVGCSEIEIAAAPEVAWDVLTEIEGWPSWNPEVKSVSMDGGLDEGAVFRWKSGPGTITSTIEAVEAPRRIAWSGTSFGIKAFHVHTLEAQNGGTLVRTEESYDGLVARLFHGLLQKTLDKTLRGGLAHLKTEAERRGSSA